MTKFTLMLFLLLPTIGYSQFSENKYYLNAGFSFLKTKSEVSFNNSNSPNPDPVISKGQYTLSLSPGVFLDENSIIGVSLSVSNQVRYENSTELKTRPKIVGGYYKKINMFNDIIGIQMKAGINGFFGYNEYLRSQDEIWKSRLSGFNIELKGGAVIRLGENVLFELNMPLIQFIRLSEKMDDIKYTDTAFTTALNSNEYSPYELGFTFIF